MAEPGICDARAQCIRLGALCESFLAITNIGTAVVLWPIVKRQSETLALSYVASRVVESIIIVVGLISLLSVVTLREDFAGAGADAGSLSVAGESLVAIHDWTFLLGPGFCVGVNGLLLGYLFYRSGLVPRWITVFGLVGGPLIFCFGDRRAVRRLRTRRGALPLFDPGDRLRGGDHHLHHRQGLQAVADSRRRPVWPSRRGSLSPSVNAPQGAASRARFGEALDLVVKRQEPLARQVEAVVGPQLAVGDEDEDPFLEIEQLENGEGVSLAVD